MSDSRVPEERTASAVDAVHDPRRVIEAVLMVAPEPVPTAELAELLEVPVEQVTSLLGEMAGEILAAERGFVLAEVAGGWRFQSHPDLAPYIERWVLEGQSARMSAAALETLAIVAYKQPISRAQVAAIRGVGVDGVVRTLEQRGYITEVARDPGPGQAVLFGTTPAFLEKLGLASLADLPPVAEFVPDATVVEQLEEGLRPRPRVEEPAGTDTAEPAADETADELGVGDPGDPGDPGDGAGP
jgi:segregation and condensation protein B